MKRRDFFKWLPAIPIGINALRSKEEPKVEVKPEPEPAKPVEPVRRTLGPQQGQFLTSSSYTVAVPLWWEKDHAE